MNTSETQSKIRVLEHKIQNEEKILEVHKSSLKKRKETLNGYKIDIFQEKRSIKGDEQRLREAESEGNTTWADTLKERIETGNGLIEEIKEIIAGIRNNDIPKLENKIKDSIEKIKELKRELEGVKNNSR